MKLWMNQLLTRKTILKLIFSYNLRCSDRMHNSAFELYTSHEVTFGFLYSLHKLQEMVKEKFKCYCINLHLKLNSHKTDSYKVTYF